MAEPDPKSKSLEEELGPLPEREPLIHPETGKPCTLTSGRIRRRTRWSTR
jgi:hypothetical protein